MAEDGSVGCRHGERDLCECGIEGVDPDDGVFFGVEAEGAEESVDFDFGVGGPETDVVTVLVGYAGAFGGELDVYAVPVEGVLEELTGDGERGGVRVFGVVDAFGTGESARGEFA